jgi:hypothetical protein
MLTSMLQATTSLAEDAIAGMTLVTIVAASSQVAATEMTLGAVSHQVAAVVVEAEGRA